MITLEEYLGTLVVNLAQARVLADIESAKIAEAYASNNLLKHFSIPRMKIEEVELVIPVAVAKIDIDKKSTPMQKLKGETKESKNRMGRIMVIVEADRLKEKDPNTFIVIKMKISEEGMEWERINDGQGNIVSKLMPA